MTVQGVVVGMLLTLAVEAIYSLWVDPWIQRIRKKREKSFLRWERSKEAVNHYYREHPEQVMLETLAELTRGFQFVAVFVVFGVFAIVADLPQRIGDGAMFGVALFSYLGWVYVRRQLQRVRDLSYSVLLMMQKDFPPGIGGIPSDD